MYADEEEKFNRTTGWCGLVYPLPPSRYPHHFHPQILHLQHLLSYENIPRIHGNHRLLALLYVLFKIFIRAWIKRRLPSCIRRSTPCTGTIGKVEQGTGKHVDWVPFRIIIYQSFWCNSASITTTFLAESNNTNHPLRIIIHLSSRPFLLPWSPVNAIYAKRAENYSFPFKFNFLCVSCVCFRAFDSVNLYRIAWPLSIRAQPSIVLVLLYFDWCQDFVQATLATFGS